MSGTTTLTPSRENTVAGLSATTTAAVCYSFDTLAELAAFDTTTAPALMTAVVAGSAAAGDGLGGLFYWQPSATTTADGLNIVAPQGSAIGRWTRFDIVLDNVSSVTLTTTAGHVVFGTGTTSAEYTLGISGPDLQLVNAGGAGGTLQLGTIGLSTSGALNVGGATTLQGLAVAGAASVAGMLTAGSTTITGTATAAGFSGPLTGNASTATALATPRTISLTGDASASGLFNGTSNLALSVTLADQGSLVPGTYAGVTFSSKGLATTARALNTADIGAALGYTAYSAANPAGYVNAAGATAASAVRTVATRSGDVLLTTADLTDFAAVAAGMASATVGGDLSGTLPNPTVARVNGVPISFSAPAANDRLIFDGTRWTNQAAPLVNSNVGTFTNLTANAQGQITAVRALSGTDVAGALGFTPYSAANPSGFISAAALTPYAVLASPVFTGNPQGPTVLAADSSASFATTAFVKNQNYATTAAVPTKLSQLSNDAAYVTGAQAAAAAPVQLVAGRAGNVTLVVADVAGAAPLTSPGLLGTPTAPTPTNGDNSTRLATTAFVSGAGFLTGNQTITLSGDATGSGANGIVLTLKATGIAGSYRAVTTDAQGRVTAGSNPTTLAGYAITDAVGNAGGVSALLSGVAGARPVAGAAGRIYVATDTGAQAYDNGTAWVPLQAPLTGDVTSVGLNTSLAVVNSNVGAFSNLTVNAKGLVTAARALSAADIGAALGYTAYSAANPSGYLTSAALAPYATLAGAALTGVPTAPTPLAGDSSTTLATTAFVKNQSYLTANQAITLGGDLTGSGTSSITAALKATGTPGTYGIVTTDSAGRVVSGSNPTTLAGYGITNAVPNAGGVASLTTGVAAAMPVAAQMGRLYFATDSGGIFYDTGSAWVLLEPGITGDATSAAGGTALTLATVNSNVGAFGGITVNAKGLVTAARAPNSADITTALGFAPYSAANPSGFITAAALASLATTASPSLTGTPTAPTPASADASTTLATTAFVKNQSYLTGNQSITVSGDAAGTGTTALALTLKAVGTPGSYGRVSTDSAGRVTAGTNPTTLAGHGITDAVQAPGGIASVAGGLAANRPAPGTAGRLYVATDSAAVFYDTGAAWTLLQPALTGDLSSTGAITTLAVVNGTPGVYSNLTVNAKGLVTAGRAISSADVVAALGFTPYSAANPAAYAPISGMAAYALLDSPQFVNTPMAPTPTAGDSSLRLATTAFVSGAGFLTANQTISVTGDVAGTGTTALALTLKATGTPGSYGRVTTDSAGRVTAGSNPSTVAGFGITDAVSNGGGASQLLAGAIAARPAAAVAGRMFFATDTGAIFYDTGTAWTALDAALTGDVTSPAGSTNTTLAIVNSNVGSFGGLTVNAKGLVTAARAPNAADIATALGFTPYSAANPSGFITAAGLSSYAPLTSPGLLGSPTAPTPSTGDNSTALATTGFVKNQSYLTANQTISVTGDVTGSGTTALALTLKATGTPGSYHAVTTDSAGRVLSGSNPTTLSGFGITDAVQNGGGTGPLLTGVLSARPLAGSASRFYLATDVGTVFYDTGTAWLGMVPIMSGDITTAPGSAVTTLATVNSNIGAFGNVTVNAKGLVTAARAMSSADIVAALGFTPYSASNPAGYTATAGLNGLAPLASPAFTGSPTAPTTASGDNSGAIATTAFVKNQSYLTANQTITLSGDATGSGTTALAIALKATGTPGSYGRVTTDAQGRVTAGSNPTTLAGFGVTDAVQNGGGVGQLIAGAIAARPAPSTSGRVFLATDTGAIYFDTGLAWTLLEPASSGDVSSGPGATVMTLATVNANVGSFGGLTVNAKGLVTAARALVATDITTALGYSPANNVSPGLSGVPTAPTPTNADNSTTLATTAFVKNQSYLTANQTITASGDVTGSGSTALALTLRPAGTAGTYSQVTTDAQGRVISGSSPTTLAGYGITNGVLNSGGATGLMAGTIAARPNPGTAGRSYLTTDTGAIYFDTGVVWTLLEPALTGDVTSAAGGTVATLATVNANIGTFGMLTVNAKGLVTAARMMALADVSAALGYTPASLVSPIFTGNPAAPTVGQADNSTALATTAWVRLQGYGTGSSFTLAPATATNLGGVKQGANVSIAGDGTLTVPSTAFETAGAGAAAQAASVPRSGTTMTGALILSADPVVGLGAATKEYVDARVGVAAPGGVSGQLQVNYSGVLGGLSISGDASLNTGTGLMTVSKINGVTVTFGGAFSVTGANTVQLITAGSTSLTLPTSGTLTTAQALTSAVQTAIPAATGVQLYVGSGIAGAMTMVNLGTNLSIAGNVLNATGSGGGGGSVPRVISSGTSAVLAAGDCITGVNQTTAAPITITLPAAPTAGTPYVVVDIAGAASVTNAITIAANAGQAIRGDAVITAMFGAVTLYYFPTLSVWMVTG